MYSSILAYLLLVHQNICLSYTNWLLLKDESSAKANRTFYLSDLLISTYNLLLAPWSVAKTQKRKIILAYPMLHTDLHIFTFQNRPISKPTNLGKFDFFNFYILHFASEKCEMLLLKRFWESQIRRIFSIQGLFVSKMVSLESYRSVKHLQSRIILFRCVLAPDQGGS